jgi:hypothetical protein
MSHDHGTMIALGFLLGLVVLLGLIVWSVDRDVSKHRGACEARGGVYIQSRSGHACVQPR